MCAFAENLFPSGLERIANIGIPYSVFAILMTFVFFGLEDQPSVLNGGVR